MQNIYLISIHYFLFNTAPQIDTINDTINKSFVSFLKNKIIHYPPTCSIILRTLVVVGGFTRVYSFVMKKTNENDKMKKRKRNKFLTSKLRSNDKSNLLTTKSYISSESKK
jgi:hypothetical protein